MPDVLTAAEINSSLTTIPAWKREDRTIERRFTFANFAESMSFVQHIADLAEEANHHPDIDIRWNTVLLRLTTHSAGGLTAADIALARRIDGLNAGGEQ